MQCRLVDFLHAEYAQEGIRAFSMHPGNVTSGVHAERPVEQLLLLTHQNSHYASHARFSCLLSTLTDAAPDNQHLRRSTPDIPWCAAELALGTPPDTHYLLVDPPELAAGVCLYLTTPQADFLRGRFVRANWDLAELEQRSVEIVEQDLFKMKLVC